MPHWFPAKPDSGHCVPPPWDQGPAPRRGSQPHGLSGRGWALVQGRPAGNGAEVAGRTAPALCTDISEQTSPAAHNSVPGHHAAQPPRPHRHLLAAVPPGRLPSPPLQAQCQSSALPHGLAQPARPPRSASLSPHATGAIPASPAWSAHAQRRLVQRRVAVGTGGHR